MEVKFRAVEGKYSIGFTGKDGVKNSYLFTPGGLFINSVKQDHDEVPDELGELLKASVPDLKVKVVDDQGHPILLDSKGVEFDIGGKILSFKETKSSKSELTEAEKAAAEAAKAEAKAAKEAEKAAAKAAAEAAKA